MTSRGKEVYWKLNSLASLACGLVGKYVIVDYRNDSSANGKIEDVDGFINLTMSDVVFTDPVGNQHYFDLLYVRDRNIRYIQFPKEMDFLFCDYDFVGFDLDNTLCEYNLNEMVRMEYNVMSDFLVEKGYPKNHLKKELDNQSLDFMQRGLILDFQRGNILKLDCFGNVMKATHGSKPLEQDTVIEIYGLRNGNCPLLNKIKACMTDAWNPECLSKYRLLLDYFDLPASLAFARCVDSLEERGDTDFSRCGDDTIGALRHMYNRDHFASGISAYFNNMKADPERYIIRSDPRLLAWLRNLRKKKRLFLVTGSNCDLADFVAGYSLGPDWRNLFDVVVCFARKPFFFLETNEFRRVVDGKEGGPVQKIELGGIYNQGNWRDLEALLQQTSERRESRGLYFGDNVVQDVFTPAKFQLCDTVAICEEMNDSHPAKPIVSSTFWGPMHAEGSWWGNVMKMYSKAILPSISLLAR